VGKPKLLILQSKRHFHVPTFAESPAIKEQFEVKKRKDFKGRPDLIYTQSFMPYRADLLKAKVPYVVHMGGNPWLELRGKRLKIADDILSNAAVVVCLSEFLAGEIRKEFSGDPERVVVLPGGLWGQSHTPIGTSEDRFDPKDDYAIVGKRPRVVMSLYLHDTPRLWNKWRGIPVFLETVAGVAKAENVTFVCSGRGNPYFKHLAEWEDKYDFHFVRAHHLDNDEDTWPALLRASDVFVHPGMYDCWPRVIADAMLTGLPCMAYDITGNAEVGESVATFKPGDRGNLAMTFQRLLRNEGARASLGRRCRSEALEKSEKHAGDYAKLLMEVYNG